MDSVTRVFRPVRLLLVHRVPIGQESQLMHDFMYTFVFPVFAVICCALLVAVAISIFNGD